ncbi:MAG: hypothetical protein RLZZ28_1478 [Bacteroidota bacterium]|jgi:UDP-2,3-diacylglucosamine pyrophosphatase LpxH
MRIGKKSAATIIGSCIFFYTAFTQPKAFVFVSDTQAPLGIETILQKRHFNEEATKLIFKEILLQKPETVFILGDVVSLGYTEKKWKKIDEVLDTLRKKGIKVKAILGNHDIMIKPKKGEAQFQKRFPDEKNTGYYSITDSIGVILLNSNFGMLSPDQIKQQQAFYEETIRKMDADPGILQVIVTCHHPPFSNSKKAGSDKEVEERFLPEYYRSAKAGLFITGHAHVFQHFIVNNKNFLTLGGGGGLHHAVKKGRTEIKNFSESYNPEFHYLFVQRTGNGLNLVSRKLNDDFTGFETGYTFTLLPLKQ